MKPSALAKSHGLSSLREVAQMVDRKERILYTWGRERPALLEAIIIGCGQIKRNNKNLSQG